jgi:hypothetical protein
VQAGVAADSPECGGARQRVRWCGPRSCCGASFRARAGSTRSWSKRARIQGFKEAGWASTAADTERGRRGVRRRAGAGATVCVDDQGWREVDAYHQKTEKTSLPARKKLRWRARGGAPADGVGAPGDVEDVNLRQEKTP